MAPDVMVPAHWRGREAASRSANGRRSPGPRSFQTLRNAVGGAQALRLGRRAHVTASRRASVNDLGLRATVGDVT
ncbi:hypothetical protein MTO96_020339 [Rhipicephalus appendiculatus]